MNLLALKRSIEHLQVLLAIRSDDDELALALLAWLAIFFENSDSALFKQRFIDELRVSYESLLEGMGLDPDDFKALIEKELTFQEKYLGGFITDLEDGTISDNQAQARARQYAGSLGKFEWQVTLTQAGDKLMKWVWNETAEHCGDCKLLNGEIRTAKTWLATIYPRSGDTQCRMSCRCDLIPV